MIWYCKCNSFWHMNNWQREKCLHFERDKLMIWNGDADNFLHTCVIQCLMTFDSINAKQETILHENSIGVFLFLSLHLNVRVNEFNDTRLSHNSFPSYSSSNLIQNNFVWNSSSFFCIESTPNSIDTYVCAMITFGVCTHK